ncbi:MAG: hypothetical protein ACK4TK_09345 [Thiobacillaceae bacterium]
MQAKSILSVSLALLALAATPALASTGEPTWAEPALRLAQLSAEERRELMLRWERLPPEEQALLRQEFRERLQALPPEQRAFRRREILENWREQPGRERWERGRDWQERRGPLMDERDWRGEDDMRGFGRGFERRQELRERPGRR